MRARTLKLSNDQLRRLGVALVGYDLAAAAAGAMGMIVEESERWLCGQPTPGILGGG